MRNARARIEKMEKAFQQAQQDKQDTKKTKAKKKWTFENERIEVIISVEVGLKE